MGGCRARAFLEYGSFKAPNPLCESFKRAGLFTDTIEKNKK
jgi:hypothetical protein